jgi:hypothetical protein
VTKSSRVGIAAALLLAAAVGPARAESGAIAILVLKERGVGSPTLAQPYVDRFVTLAAKANNWGAAKGQYLNSRTAAEAFIKANGPHYGIFSLGAFLAMRKPYRLEVVGRVASTLAGGEQYFIVSKSARDLSGCKGKTLASDHTEDARFIERVVARGTFRLVDFEVVQNARPLQSIKQVLNGTSECALIDDAQRVELEHLAGAAAVRVVWSSKKLPPMALAAFPSAPSAERKVFQAKLRDVCTGPGQTVCAEVGIRGLEVAGAAEYAEVVTAYGR